MAPSDRVVLGFIGLGRQGVGDFGSFTGCPGVQVVAGSDVDSMKRDRFSNRVNAWQKRANITGECKTYEFYEDLLNRKDIDAVSIATPDHWHALTTIHACQAKKDVYCQKPLSYTITESLAMVKAVRCNKRVLQVGSQQRSDKEFIQAIRLVRSGAIGHITAVDCRIGEPPRPYDLPVVPIPENLNFNQWLGPLNDPNVHYHPNICLQLDSNKNEIGGWAEWRYYKETGNGFTGDWGAHMIDIAQVALGMDGTQPVEYIPIGYNGAKYSSVKYANGLVMSESPFRDDKKDDKGVRFHGTKGWLKVSRGYIECSDPKLLADGGMKGGNDDSVAQLSAGHMQNFIDCVRSRKNPIAPVEVGCSTNITCCLVNIAHELKRPVKWDPATLSFPDDKEAESHRLYWYQYRNPYTLPYWDNGCC
jgi:predicted dehydrogenase